MSPAKVMMWLRHCSFTLVTCRGRDHGGSHCDEDEGQVGREGDEAIEEEAHLAATVTVGRDHFASQESIWHC